MSTILRSITVFAACLLIPVALLAQPGQQRGPQLSPDEYAKSTVAALSEKIELSDTQKDSLTATFKVFRESLASVMQNRETARQKMEEATKKRDKAVEGILDDKDKYNAYLKFVEEQQPMGRPGGNRGSGPRGN